MVWISTCGGANSGKTSTLCSGISAKPRASMAVAAKTTSQRKRRLVATMRRISRPSRSTSVPSRDVELGAVDLGGAHGDHAVPAGGPSASSTRSSDDAVHDDLREGRSAARGSCRPTAALAVVDERGVGTTVAPRVLARRRLERRPVGALLGERHRLHVETVDPLDRRRLVASSRRTVSHR